jgi:hypothetical protein
VDFLGEFTAGLFGHSNHDIAEAIGEAMTKGWNFGGPNLYERKLAKKVSFCLLCSSLLVCKFSERIQHDSGSSHSVQVTYRFSIHSSLYRYNNEMLSDQLRSPTASGSRASNSSDSPTLGQKLILWPLPHPLPSLDERRSSSSLMLIMALR